MESYLIVFAVDDRDSELVGGVRSVAEAAGAKVTITRTRRTGDVWVGEVFGTATDAEVRVLKHVLPAYEPTAEVTVGGADEQRPS